MNRHPRSLFAVVAACFFLSGTAGLIYQVVWSRYLALFLGHTSYAVVAVLVAFMGGLALGNAWFGAVADRSAKPLAVYAGLEIGIGVYALLFPTYEGYVHAGFVKLARTLQPGSGGLLAMKFLLSGITIVPPTILMGASFPVLTRYVTRSLGELRDRVAALYAINSAGAVAGCLVADFWWIPSLGLELTLYGAAGLNLGVGLVSLVLSLRTEQSQVRKAPMPDPGQSLAETYTGGELRIALIGIGVSGFVAMLYEVAWTRLLALALGSSTHAFSLMLITFITGIALGAWLVYLWHGARRSSTLFAWAELALALSLLVSMFFYQDLSYWFVKWAGLLARREQAYALYALIEAGLCFMVMLVPTVCLGMTLPLISRVATVELSCTGRSIGTVFAINTLGTVLGAVLTGLWLLPWLGLAKTFSLGIILNALIGLAALQASQGRARPAPLLLAMAATVALVWSVGAGLDSTWQRTFSLGLWRAPHPPATLEAVRQAARAVPLRYHKDGAGATVDVYAWNDRGQEQLTLKVNGKADAGTSTDMITQLLLGHIPLLLHPQARQVLVIGLGSGMTCGAVAQHPSVQQVEAVEISPEVVEGAKLFGKYNHQILADPKLHLAIEDAKSFLLLSDHKYDLIVSEPSNPWMAGVAAVFSREYYESCATRLQPDGLMTQWMHIYETTDETISLVLRTFLSVFPYTSIWQPAVGDLVLVGGTRPLSVDMDATIARFHAPNVQADLARVGLDTLATVLAREIVPQQNGLFIVTSNGAVHSDYYPALEYLAQRGFFLNRLAEGWRAFREDFSPRASTWFGSYLQHHPLGEEDFNAFVRDFQDHHIPEPPLFRSLLKKRQSGSTRPAFALNLWTAASEGVATAEVRALNLAPLRESMMEEAAQHPEPLRIYSSDLMESYRAERSIFYLPPTTDLEAILVRLLETDPSHQRVYRLRLAEIAWDRGDDARCLELGQSGLDPDPARSGPVDFSLDPQGPPAVLYRMAESYWRSGRLAEAWSLCQGALASGYLANTETVFPLLNVTYHRIQAAVAPAESSNSR